MLRLDPHLAVFRTAPDRIAIGAQTPIAELDADEPTLRGIAALTRGVVRRELEHLLGDEPAAALLLAVEPALEAAPPALPVLVRGRIPLAAALHRAVRQAEHPRPLGRRAPGDGVIVPVAAWRLPEAETERLLAAGDAHLPVVVGDVWVQVGPFVPAGARCPRCLVPDPPLLLPGHLTPAPSAIATAQSVVTVLGALRRASDGELPAGWTARIRQRDAAVTAVRRSRARCQHRSQPGTEMAA
ncbi:hypothetical protein [Agrococcus citreus]|uniref:Bacteriocin biosynthesis cyclodehydratase domain-containing protein n=1 Tax=Agrococcus citreus TaxID=84643 RepID=A0ABP4J9X5_9MICO